MQPSDPRKAAAGPSPYDTPMSSLTRCGVELVAWIAGPWAALPLGIDVAWRLNLLSAVLGAACAPAVLFTVRAALAPGKREREAAAAAAVEEPRWLREIPPGVAATAFVFSHTFWRQATITEV